MSTPENAGLKLEVVDSDLVFNQTNDGAITTDTPPTDDTPGSNDISLENDREDSPNDDEDDDDDQLFEGSTHQYFIYFGSTKDIPKLIVAIFVICVQCTLYSVILWDAAKGISGDEFTIPVKVRFGRSCEKIENLVCPPELPNLGYTTLAGCILAFFLMYDIIAGLRIMFSVSGFWGKLGATIILIESFMAATAGTLFALSADEGYDAIANCIGVLFIHDVDEKAFEAFQAIKFDKLCGRFKKKLCKKLSAPHSVVFVAIFAVMVFSMSMAGIVREVQLTHITKAYGEGFTEKFFSDAGYYEYHWDDSDSYVPWKWWYDYDSSSTYNYHYGHTTTYSPYGSDTNGDDWDGGHHYDDTSTFN